MAQLLYLPLAKSQPQPKPKLDWFTLSFFILLHLAAGVGAYFFFSWGALAVAGAIYAATNLFGITLGYHRLLSHRSFKAPRWLERTLATLGVLAGQASPLEWVAIHRMHHAFVDSPDDPHDATRGFWWSHFGWMVLPLPQARDLTKLRRFARDIVADPYLNWLTRPAQQFAFQTALGLLLLTLGGPAYLVWGVFVRLVVGYHATWFVNSVAHKFGYQSYDVGNRAANSWWVALLTFGEGWHNNHHAYPDLAQAGHKKWEIDPTFLVIKALAAVGLATDVRTLDRLKSERANADHLAS